VSTMTPSAHDKVGANSSAVSAGRLTSLLPLSDSRTCAAGHTRHHPYLQRKRLSSSENPICECVGRARPDG
jgi:hypothetical protein